MARNTYAVDEELDPDFKANVLKRLGHYLRPHLKPVLAAVVLMLLASVGSLVAPFLVGYAIDKAIPVKDFKLLFILAGAIALGQLVNAVCLRIKIKIMNVTGQDIIHRIRSDIFKRLQQLPFSYFDSRPQGKILIRVVNYVNSVSDLLSNGLINFITDLITLVIVVILMFCTNIQLTLICLAGMPFLGGAILLMKKRQRTSWQKMSRKQSNLNAYLSEALSGVKVTQSFSRESFNDGIFEKLSSDWKSSWLTAVANLFLVQPVIETVSVLVVCVVYAFGILGFKTAISIGALVAFVGYVWRFWSPFSTIGQFYSSLVQSAAYLERIFETIDEPTDIQDAADAYDLPPIRGHVEFRSVRFSYDKGSVILPDLTFCVTPGQSIAIVGPTGAGKTTIVNLLSRFYNPDSGSILIDGHDPQKLSLRSLRSQMGVMLQDPVLFSGTIRDNIRYGRLDASDRDIEAAAEAVHAHEFILSLEKGYDTQVSERGMRLSMGQRQLICFARVLLSNPRILILDEATSSIDTETERLVQKGIAGLLKGRTSFIIAHRLSTIRNADRIMYLENGAIVESGSHDELMARNGSYAKLYRKGQEAALAAADDEADVKIGAREKEKVLGA